MTSSGEAGTEDWRVGVAVPAAGLGTRMGGVRKPFLEIAGEPLLLFALRPFLRHPRVTAVAVALGEEDAASPPSWLGDLDDRIKVVPGGATRGDSVWSALQALPESVPAVAVHDAARPLVTAEMIDRCLAVLTPNRGVVVGWPAVDTLKEVDETGRVFGTLRRERIWHAQTPQVFPRALLTEAYRQARKAGVVDTDDSALIERLGGEVVMVPGSASNLKITRPEDLPLAELFLTLRARGEV